jgi:CxxC motif-containing protein (DUF1111 family)
VRFSSEPIFQEADAMIRRSAFLLILPLAAMAVAFEGVAQDATTEAPAGFDTPTLVTHPGSQSSSNGIAEPPGDAYVHDQTTYEEIEDVTTGLGPLYNGRSCAECHQNPVSGGLTNITGRSVINDRAVLPAAQEHLPVTENIRAFGAALNTLGDGFVEAIADSTLLAIAQQQPGLSDGRIHGLANAVPVLEAPGQNRIGRFGWKDQHSSLLSFVGDAYLNEMGVTNRLRPHDTTTIGKITPDPEDTPDNLGLADIDHFAQFVRGTKVPPRDTTLAATPDAIAGAALFEKIGCATCHVSSIVTAPAGTVINGGAFSVPAALGNKIIHPYGDYLLHDLGTGDGIVQNPPEETANKMRTAPLWGLRERPRYMHDLRSLTLGDAIERHRGEAEDVERHFDRLSDAAKQQIFTFLNSL